MVDVLPLSLAVVSTIFGALATLLFKLASKKVKIVKEIIVSKEFLAGAALFLIATSFMIAALKFGELSEIFPLTALTYVWVAILSFKVLKEKVTATKIVGFLLIFAGIILIAV